MSTRVEASGSNVPKDPNVRVKIGKTNNGFKEVLANTVDSADASTKEDPEAIAVPLAIGSGFSTVGAAMASIALTPPSIAAPLVSTDLSSPFSTVFYSRYKVTEEKNKKLTPPS